MATVALIQSLFRVLTHESSDELHGFQAQIYDDFYEALEEQYNHNMRVARTLDEFLQKEQAQPDVVICAPFAEEGNPAPGLAEIHRFKEAFPNIPIIIWSTRTEDSLRNACLQDLGCAAYYTGTLLDAPDDLPQIIAKALT
jgi:DNA-binding NarL/FixJ family response regulator